jgi:hypothetical protein
MSLKKTYLYLAFGMSLQIAQSNPCKPEPGATGMALSSEQLAVEQKAASKGSADAAYRLSRHYLVAMNDVTRGLAFLLKAAELGSSDAQYELGSYLINEPDKQKEGMVWIRKASEAGNLKAQHLLELLKKEKIRKSR